MKARAGQLLLVLGITGCLTVSAPIPTRSLGYQPWYASEVCFADWRDVGPVDFSSNPGLSWYYSGHMPAVLRPAHEDSLFARLDAGDTLLLGFDYYAFKQSRPYIDERLLSHIGEGLLEGRVAKVKLWVEEGQYVMELQGEE